MALSVLPRDDNTWEVADRSFCYYAWRDGSDTCTNTFGGVHYICPDANVRLGKIGQWEGENPMKAVGCVALCVLTHVSALARGSVYFANYVPREGMNAPFYDYQGQPLTGSAYVAQLVVCGRRRRQPDTGWRNYPFPRQRLLLWGRS